MLRSLAFAALAVGFAPTDAFALVGKAAACEAGLEARVDSILSPYSGRVPGASLLILKDGKPLVRESRGFADLEAGRPAAPDTNYRLASVSKQFTAMAVLLLVQDGVLKLDQPVHDWLPSLPPATRAITLRQLLSHRSGLVDYEDFVPDDAPQVRDADVLRILESQDRTLFPPGSDYRYSNSGFALLSLVVERASKQDYPGFVRERIFGPLGMPTSSPSPATTAAPALRRCPRSTTPARPGNWDCRRSSRPCAGTTCAIACACRSTAD